MDLLGRRVLMLTPDYHRSELRIDSWSPSSLALPFVELCINRSLWCLYLHQVDRVATSHGCPGGRSQRTTTCIEGFIDVSIVKDRTVGFSIQFKRQMSIKLYIAPLIHNQ
jgi:hypothetical protein